jgi:hypothetical protein
MAFDRLVRNAAVRRRRLLINGGPNMRKTTVALSAPKPLGIISLPGEKGFDSIPHDDPEIIPYVWQLGENEKLDSTRVVKQVFDLSTDLIAGKHGEITTFVGDGLHKFFEYIMDDVTDGAWFAGAEFEPKLYALAYRRFEEYLSKVMHSIIPVVIFTIWDGDAADRKKRQGEKASDVPTSIMPDLPGQAARKIMGEFSMVVHQSLRQPKPGEKPVAYWQTSPSTEIKGCGIKGPIHITSKIPQFIPADYAAFDKLWRDLELGVNQQAAPVHPNK